MQSLLEKQDDEEFDSKILDFLDLKEMRLNE